MKKIFADCAPAFWERGYSVLPIEPGSKRPAKEIKGWQGHCNGPPSVKIREEWLARYAGNGIGLLLSTEVASGWRIAAVDVDDSALVEVVRAVLGDCFCGKIGKKGATFFAKVPSATPPRSTVLTDHTKTSKIDVLINGKMSVLPPTVHPDTSEPYQWLGSPLLECDVYDLPLLSQRKLDLLRLIVRAEESAILIAGESTHGAGIKLVWRLIEFGCGDHEIVGIVTALLPADYSGNSLDELSGWIVSAREKLTAPSDRRPLDEEVALSVASALDPVAFIPGEGFRRYLDGHWPLVTDREVDRQSKALLSPRLKAHQQLSSYLSNVRRCLELNAERTDFGRSSGGFLIGLRNGTYDVKRGALVPHAPAHELRYQLDFDFDERAACPTYEDQLAQTFKGSKQAMDLFDEFAGLTLVPDMRFQKALYLIGAAGSGKSTLLRVLESLHDPAAVSVTPLDRIDSERYLTDLATKLVCISFDIQTVKSIFGEGFMRITGGDAVSIRKLIRRSRAGSCQPYVSLAR